jgi:secreted trypsin-like serine protease
VIKTKTRIVLSPTVQPIALNPNPVGEVDAIISGWGMTFFPGDRLDANIPLQWLAKRTITNQECIRNFPAANIFESTLCAFSGAVGKGVCSADSGSPLVANNQVIGVVSFGAPCATGIPDGYARVSFYYDWIQKSMK